MKWIKLTIRGFLIEPLWFKILISVSLLTSIILSNSIFSEHAYLQSGSKLAAALFFFAYGIRFRKNYRTAVAFFACTVLCIYLSIQSIL